MRGYGFLTCAALVLAATPALAQDGPPDLSGFWNLDYGDPLPEGEALIAKLPPNTALLEDVGFVEYDQGVYGDLQPTEKALAKAAEWTPAVEMTLARVCLAPSVIYTEQGPFPFEIHQTPTLIVFKYEYFDQVRLIHLDGRGHPPADAPHSKVGHSIGHWEGDELVIDTTHISSATLTNNGLDHSDNVHLVERYKLSADKTMLVATQWFEDPEMLHNAGARLIQWKKFEGQYVYPYDCDPSISVEYGQTGE